MGKKKKYAHFGRYGAKKKKFVNILIYDTALCALPLRSDTQYSSYEGSKVGFDTFLAITWCVYIGAHNNFYRVHIIEENIFDKNRHVIQGHSRSFMGILALKTIMLILGDMGQRNKNWSIFDI